MARGVQSLRAPMQEGARQVSSLGGVPSEGRQASPKSSWRLFRIGRGKSEVLVAPIPERAREVSSLGGVHSGEDAASPKSWCRPLGGENGGLGSSRGFSLLEIMVAVAILGLALTVILSAQAGLYSSGNYARNVSQATGLARCKMTELEERLLKLGYPLVSESDEGACCDDGAQPTSMRCSWKVETVTLPEPTSIDTLFGEGRLDSSMGPLGALAAIGQNPSMVAEAGDAGLSQLAGALSGASGGSPSMGAAALAPLVMGMVYPQLKPMLEASIRKVTVKVSWKEGKLTRDFEIVQYVTNPMQGGLMPGQGGLDSLIPGLGTGTGTGIIGGAVK